MKRRKIPHVPKEDRVRFDEGGSDGSIWLPVSVILITAFIMILIFN